MRTWCPPTTIYGLRDDGVSAGKMIQETFEMVSAIIVNSNWWSVNEVSPVFVIDDNLTRTLHKRRHIYSHSYQERKRGLLRKETLRSVDKSSSPARRRLMYAPIWRPRRRRRNWFCATTTTTTNWISLDKQNRCIDKTLSRSYRSVFLALNTLHVSPINIFDPYCIRLLVISYKYRIYWKLNWQLYKEKRVKPFINDA